jgi:hypothetical protein
MSTAKEIIDGLEQAAENYHNTIEKAQRDYDAAKKWAEDRMAELSGNGQPAKPGRPKGSRNKPKVKDATVQPDQASVGA